MTDQPKHDVLILIGSPRRNGNSAALAEGVRRGVEGAGGKAAVRVLDDYLGSFLKDCRSCRLESGECGIADDFGQLFFNDFLPAKGVVFCSPIYWYGLSAQTKAFFDRTFCYYAQSYPASEDVIDKMSRKRIGLVLASEETYPGASLGIVHQVQEYSRYTHSEFIGVVRGVGNKRSEVSSDPSQPIHDAEKLGSHLLERCYTDYRIDTPRSGRVWDESG